MNGHEWHIRRSNLPLYKKYGLWYYWGKPYTGTASRACRDGVVYAKFYAGKKFKESKTYDY